MSASRTKSPSDFLPLPSGRERREIIKYLEERDGRFCAFCKASIPKEAPQNSDWQLALMRKTPPSKGGTNDLENLQLTHRKCSAGDVVACPSGKIRYESRQEALGALESVMLAWVRSRGHLARRREQTFYQCDEPKCKGGWHLTSRPPRGPR